MNRTGALYFVSAPLLLGLQAWLAVRYAALFSFGPSSPRTALYFGLSVGGALLPMLAIAATAWARIWSQAPSTRGRARLLTGASAGLVNVAAWLAIAAIVLNADPRYLASLGIRMGMSPALRNAVAAALAVVAGSGAVMLGSSIAAWFLLAKRARERIWYALDILLLAALIAAWVMLPSRPLSQEPGALGPPLIRHAITTCAVLRLVVRLVPLLLDLVERAGFQPLVAARQLRSHKSGFLAAISVLSIMAVMVSCCALTTTLSVMGGFRSDLKRKILGNNAHVVIDRERRTIETWRPVLEAARAAPGVAGVSPYVTGEVMLASASNFSGAVLRGIQPDSLKQVSDLPRNLRAGKLEYLDHPERVLESRDEDLLNGLPPPLPPVRHDSDKSAASSLDQYLLAPEPQPEKPATAQAELLPGIILGQELAKSLRLFVGDEVNVISPLGGLSPSGPIPKARQFRVAGIFYSGMYEYDAKQAYVELGTAQRFLNTGEGIHGIEIKVADMEKAPAVAARLRESLDSSALRIRDWQELNSRLFGALALEKLAMFLVLGIAIVVASFCIAVTLILTVQEKEKEVAVLKAMGGADSAIVAVFMIEGSLIGALGATLGLFFGYMTCFAAEHLGIRMDPEVYYIDRLPVHIDAVEFTLVGAAAIVVCLLVTIYPALLASRTRPVETLRYE